MKILASDGNTVDARLNMTVAYQGSEYTISGLAPAMVPGEVATAILNRPSVDGLTECLHKVPIADCLYLYSEPMIEPYYPVTAGPNSFALRDRYISVAGTLGAMLAAFEEGQALEVCHNGRVLPATVCRRNAIIVVKVDPFGREEVVAEGLAHWRAVWLEPTDPR